MSSHLNQPPEMLEAGTKLMPDPKELSTTGYGGRTHVSLGEIDEGSYRCLTT
ncbi:MAG TPA: hypothetical protein VGL78_12495 [Solirubrobacteraceae bacterium]|jgi:hypothetical protein